MTDTIQVAVKSAFANREYASDDVFRPDGTINLLVDIEAPVSINRGESLRIPTPIRLQGNGRTVGLLDVIAGRRPGVEDPVGQFILPPTDAQMVVEVLVFNESGGALMIQPNYSLGVLSFMAQEKAGIQEIEGPDDAYDEHGPLPVEAVFAPQHFDASLAPSYATEGAAGMDLRADVPEAFDLQPGERRLIQTGLRTAIPAGFEGQIRPRSGHALKHGITVTNSPATIDSDYRGPIGVVLHNLGAEPFRVSPGDRIAQFVIAPVMTAALDFRDALSESGRGAGGFGSTGRD